MTHPDEERKNKIRQSHFPLSLFFKILLTVLFISGFHSGIVVGINALAIRGEWATTIVIAYWFVISVGTTLFLRYQIKKSYEEPMKRLAKAAGAVAQGDFSVYVPMINSIDQLDYLDVMIMDFNKMVEELGSIETLKTDFFSNVSHEIKTPLAVILNYAESMQNLELTQEQQQEYLHTIIQSSKRLSKLITNILKLNKLEKQNIQPIVEEYDLCEQLCDCTLQFEEIWEQKQITVDVDIEERVSIEADASLMELVWNNLLSNAIKFTAPAGTVTLQQTSTTEMVIVSIMDTGIGMSLETINHIFDKFYQGDSSRSGEGNGLGLAMVLRVIQLIGGTIEVSSELGRGSCFRVLLPVYRNR